MKTGVGLAFVCFALAAIACGSTPDAVSERPSATASSASASASPVTSAAASSTTAADPCVEARKLVVAEAAKLGACKADSDCKLHAIPLCDFKELDCHAAHVHKDGDTAQLDAAISAFSKSCPQSKCKCATPEKSVCSNGKCSAG